MSLDMTKAEWISIAETLGDLRKDLATHWKPSTARDAHDRKLIHFAQLDAIDKAARALARKFKSARFDELAFLRIAGVKK